MAANIGILKRPVSTEGVWGWITTVDHKRIGILYGVSAFIFFLIGGIEALLMRVQLAQPESTFVEAGTFNALFTMHGTTMVFMVDHAARRRLLQLPRTPHDRRARRRLSRGSTR